MCSRYVVTTGQWPGPGINVCISPLTVASYNIMLGHFEIPGNNGAIVGRKTAMGKRIRATMGEQQRTEQRLTGKASKFVVVVLAVPGASI